MISRAVSSPDTAQAIRLARACSVCTVLNRGSRWLWQIVRNTQKQLPVRGNWLPYQCHISNARSLAVRPSLRSRRISLCLVKLYLMAQPGHEEDLAFFWSLDETPTRTTRPNAGAHELVVHRLKGFSNSGGWDSSSYRSYFGTLSTIISYRMTGKSLFCCDKS